jgi:hypothetical protein
LVVLSIFAIFFQVENLYQISVVAHFELTVHKTSLLAYPIGALLVLCYHVLINITMNEFGYSLHLLVVEAV